MTTARLFKPTSSKDGAAGMRSCSVALIEMLKCAGYEPFPVMYLGKDCVGVQEQDPFSCAVKLWSANHDVQMLDDDFEMLKDLHVDVRPHGSGFSTVQCWPAFPWPDV